MSYGRANVWWTPGCSLRIITHTFESHIWTLFQNVPQSFNWGFVSQLEQLWQFLRKSLEIKDKSNQRNIFAMKISAVNIIVFFFQTFYFLCLSSLRTRSHAVICQAHEHKHVLCLQTMKKLPVFTWTHCPSKHLIQPASQLNNNQVNINCRFIQTFGELLTICHVPQNSLSFKHYSVIDA